MESKYIVVIKVDQKDADYITIATDLRDGKPDRDLLIDLCIANNFRELEEYDHAWYNLSKMDFFLSYLWDGFLLETYNRFKIEDIVIKGFDGDSKSWYEINDFSLEALRKLGIEDINKAYTKRFKKYTYDYDEDEDEDEETLDGGEHRI